MWPSWKARPGVTVLEVLLALLISAGVLLSARQLVETLSVGARTTTVAARRTDYESNAERVLRSLAAQVEVNERLGATFLGTGQEAEFTSWCATPAGWWERCAIALRIIIDTGHPVLVLVQDGQAEIQVVRATNNLALRYLAIAQRGGTWFEQWAEGTKTPLAIGIVRDADTLMLRIGERG